MRTRTRRYSRCGLTSTSHTSTPMPHTQFGKVILKRICPFASSSHKKHITPSFALVSVFLGSKMCILHPQRFIQLGELNQFLKTEVTQKSLIFSPFILGGLGIDVFSSKINGTIFILALICWLPFLYLLSFSFQPLSKFSFTYHLLFPITYYFLSYHSLFSCSTFTM